MRRLGRSPLAPLARLALLLALGAGGCSSNDEATSNRGSYNPWVLGGQTGALMPACGLTLASARGEAIPGGPEGGGVVVELGGCEPGFDASMLRLLDSDGVAVEVDVEAVDDDTVVLRPRVALQPGTYMLDGPALGAMPVRVAAAAELPTTLGTLDALPPTCGARFTLTLDPPVLAYLPQLKLNARVDGGSLVTWFDYGVLAVDGNEARVDLPQCLGGCIDSGTHELEVVAELAGELGTLEPLTLPFEVECGHDDVGDTDGDAPGGCSVGSARGADGRGALFTAALLLGLAWRRRGRRPARARTVGVLLTALSLGAAGCDEARDCTLIGAPHGLRVLLTGPGGGDLAEGRYVVTMMADGTETVLGFTVEGERTICADENRTEDPSYESQNCLARVAHGRGATLMAELRKQPRPPPPPPAAPVVPRVLRLVIWLYDGKLAVPQHVDLNVERDAVLVGMEAYEPEYTRYEVNGPGCGVTYAAEVEMPLDD